MSSQSGIALIVWTCHDGVPGLKGRWKALRVPLFIVPLSWVLKHRTMDNVLGLLRWFMDLAAVGVIPSERYDKSAWTSGP